MNKKIRCVDIELAIMRHFDFRQNLIVPNISNQMLVVPFETDMLVITKGGYAHGFEIKTSLSDLKADFKKPQHMHFNVMRNGRSGIERWYGKFKYFSYAVPESLKEEAKKLIPPFCGLFVLDSQLEPYKYTYKFYQEVKPQILTSYKWNEKQIFEVARLGAMRIYSLKVGIACQ